MLIIRTKFLLDKVRKMMKNFGQSVEINHNPNLRFIPDDPYRVLIIGGLGFGIRQN